MDNYEKASGLLNKHLYIHGGDSLGITDGNVYKAVIDAICEALRIHDVAGQSEQLVCDICNGKHNNIIPCPKCGGLSESIFEVN